MRIGNSRLQAAKFGVAAPASKAPMTKAVQIPASKPARRRCFVTFRRLGPARAE